MATPGLKPDGLQVTSCTFTTSTEKFTMLLEWENGSSYISLDLQRSVNGVSFSSVATPGGEDVSYEMTGLSPNLTYYFRIRGLTLDGYTSYSNIASHSGWYSSASDTATAADLAGTTYEASGESNLSDTAVATDSVTESIVIVETCTDTATITDSVLDASIDRLNLARFLGTNNGKVYTYSSDTHGDSSSPIQSWWESKDVDMDDQYPQFIGKYKFLHTVKLRYIDLDEHSVTMSVSTDGGLTWTNNTKTVGTGSGSPGEKIFNFWLHGRTFMVRVAHSSSDKDFQWTDMEMVFEPAGDYYGGES